MRLITNFVTNSSSCSYTITVKTSKHELLKIVKGRRARMLIEEVFIYGEPEQEGLTLEFDFDLNDEINSEAIEHLMGLPDDEIVCECNY